MHKFIFLVFSFFGVCCQLSAQSAVCKRISFDLDWKFRLGNASDPSKDFNYGIDNLFAKTGGHSSTPVNYQFNDSGWQKINVPHDWVVALPFVQSANEDVLGHGYKPVGALFPQNSIGWYRKYVTLSPKDSGQRFLLQFDGVFRDSKVWVNGVYMGSHWSGYTGFDYDVTDVLYFDKPNVITVRADATQYEGWFYEGAGIYRHVWLTQSGNVHLDRRGGVFVHSNVAPNGRRAQVTVEASIINQTNKTTNCSVQWYLATRDGRKLASSASRPVAIAVNKTATISSSIDVPNPMLWSVENPYLYRVVTLVKNGNQTIDSVVTKTGIRSVKVSADGLFVNGKYTKVKGVCNHQDHAGVGVAIPDDIQYYRLHLVKEMGANAVRTTHHAPTPELLEACDSLGLLVMDETRLLNSSNGFGMDEFENLVLRDRNHPSVFMWSVGNEEFYIQTTATGRRIAQSFLQKQRELDSTRTSTYAANVGNYLPGVNEVIPVRGFNYHPEDVPAYHKDHPSQPIIGTEMGSTVTTRGEYEKDTVRAYLPDHDMTAPPWASTAEYWWSRCAPYNWYMGGFVWTGFDYRGEPTPFEWPNINSHFGVMDMCGFPKNVYYYYKSWWSGQDVLQIAPHWNWKGKEGQPVDVWVNSNADAVELWLNGKSVGKKEMPRNGHLQWSVPYEAGTLMAVATKRGETWSETIETTGEAAEVVVTPYKTTMTADGKAAAVINITVVDKQGREVPDADLLIHFTIAGNAAIIGVGNGDPSSHEPDKCEPSHWQRRLFNGKCQVIVQSGTTPGTVHFTATADGLWEGNTDIVTVPEDNTPETVAALTPNLSSAAPGKMLGADISFLPELEDKGMTFSDKGVKGDAIQILKNHGINYIRLRIFNHPAADSGYSPGKGFADLSHTLAMAKRVKEAGLKLLLDFHYSDYWADPGKQYKPAAWKGAGFLGLKDSLFSFTKTVMQALKAQNTLPDMVQVGNEINHGMVWPEGSIAHPDSLATLLYAGICAVKSVAPQTIIMLHVALGGQYEEADAFYTQMTERHVPFDVIGLSYYPKWHGSLNDLRFTTNYLARKYNKDVVVVEYSQLKNEVNDIAFGVEGGRGKGSFIWEPLSTWEKVFDEEGKATDLIQQFDEISRKYLGQKEE